MPFRQMFFPSMVITPLTNSVYPTPSSSINFSLCACNPIEESSLRYQQDGRRRAKSFAQYPVCASGRKSPAINLLPFLPPIDVTTHQIMCIRSHVGVGFNEPRRDFAPHFCRGGTTHMQLLDVNRGSGNAVIVLNGRARRWRRALRRRKRSRFCHSLPKHHIRDANHSDLLFIVTTGAQQYQVAFDCVRGVLINVV